MIHHSVVIPGRVLAGLRRQAAAAAPAECCGALAGLLHRGEPRIRTLIPVPNQAEEPGRYLIDAPTVLRLERQAAWAGLDIVGFYHSHPHSPAAPSGLDLQLACPGYVYIIVEPAGCVRAWRVRDDRACFDELHLLTLAGAA
jgi:proteasome lid subunit RPN8/RPN11